MTTWLPTGDRVTVLHRPDSSRRGRESHVHIDRVAQNKGRSHPINCESSEHASTDGSADGSDEFRKRPILAPATHVSRRSRDVAQHALSRTLAELACMLAEARTIPSSPRRVCSLALASCRAPLAKHARYRSHSRSPATSQSSVACSLQARTIPSRQSETQQHMRCFDQLGRAPTPQ